MRIPERLLLVIATLLCLTFAHVHAEDGQLRCADQFQVGSQPKTLTYVSAKGFSGKVLHLSLAQYREYVTNERINPDTILILEEIDLSLDVPFVAGIILRKPLGQEGTHIQVLAEKLSIPLVFSRDLAVNDRNTFYTLDTSIEKPRLIQTIPPVFRQSQKSLLPANFDRTKALPLIFGNQIADDKMYQQREVVGDKFLPLQRLKWIHDDLVPRLAVLTSTHFERFKSTAVYNGEILRDFVDRKSIELEGGVSEEQTKRILFEIRGGFLNAVATAPDFWDRVKNIYSNLSYRSGAQLVSVRSNNDVEDLLAAGLYASRRGSNEGIERAVREVYASLYSYRAYRIRKSWGQREQNLAMPVLIHEYLAGNVGNAVARAKVNRDGKIEIVYDVVMGAQSHATNPSEGSKSVRIRVTKNTIEVEGADVPQVLIDSIQQLSLRILPALESDLRDVVIAPASIDLEVLFDGGERSVRPWIIQYKHTYSKEIVSDVVSGRMSRFLLDQHVATGAEGRLDIERIVKRLNATLLRTISTEDEFSNYARYRYALVKADSEYAIILWDSELHGTFKDKLARFFPRVQWIRSGYLSIARNRLEFSDTTEHLVDRGSLIWWPNAMAKRAFKKAIAKSLASDSPFSAVIKASGQREIHFSPSRHGSVLVMPIASH